MNLRLTLLLASTLMLKFAEVQPAGLGEDCSSSSACTSSNGECDDATNKCVCTDSYHQDGHECVKDCTAGNCPDGQSCDQQETKECINDPGCTQDSCPDGQSCQDVEGSMQCVNDPGCTQDSCPDGQSCQDVEGSMQCVNDPGCTQGSCPDGQSCQDVNGNMVCVADPDCNPACPDGQSCQNVGGSMQCAGAAATTTSVILLTVMTLMTFRFL